MISLLFLGFLVPALGQMVAYAPKYTTTIAPTVARQYPQMTNPTVQLSNEQMLALAAQHGLDVEAIKAQLAAGKPVEVQVSDGVIPSRPTMSPIVYYPQAQTPPPLQSSPQLIRANLNKLISTAPDARLAQVFQTKDFQDWHSDLIQNNPQLINIRHVGQP